MKKNIFTRSLKAITHPKLLICYVLNIIAPYIKNDRLYIKWKYRLHVGGKCNLDNPKTYQEKLQWIKLNDHKDIYHQMVDKYEAKLFIKEKIGEKYIIPTLGVWDRFEDIDFDSLPNEFIIKNTYDSGTYFICKDKTILNISEARERLMIDHSSRKVDYFVFSREWPYKGLKHRIIAEPLLKDEKVPYLMDYKFICINGEPKLFYILSEKNNGTLANHNYFDINGNYIEMRLVGYPHDNTRCPSLPTNLSIMIDLCKILAKNTYHLRVDFYEVNGKLYCGELTFFDYGGFGKFSPKKYNEILGKDIKLPIDK